MAKRYKAALIGGSGYGGGEIIRRLLLHPDVELVRVASVDFVGERVGAAHPNLEGVPLVFENLGAVEAAAGCDVALLALPHKVTATKVAELVAGAPGVKIVDMSGDFRLKDAAAYAKYYGQPHPCPELLPTFVYGAPELQRDAIRKATRVASPGCFATSMNLALLPAARAGWVRGPVHVTGITGSSGSGAAPAPTTHHPTRAGNLRTYKPLEHQHIPEVAETLTGVGAKELALRFVPVSAPLVRGIFTTAYLEVPADVDDARVAAAYGVFEGHPFVRRPAKRLPEVAAIAGSNHAEVGWQLGAPAGGTRTLAAFCALDNLIKGGAGQAIQNMNLVLGCAETASLEDPGSWP